MAKRKAKKRISTLTIVMLVVALVGAALAVAAVLLLLLLVFALFRVFEDTAFVQDILSQMEGSFLASLYANNPVKFIA